MSDFDLHAYWHSLPRRGWRTFAACAGMNRAPFFPEVGNVPWEVRKVCASCPVIDDCLADTLRHEPSKERHGFFGGMSARQRERFAGHLADAHIILERVGV